MVDFRRLLILTKKAARLLREEYPAASDSEAAYFKRGYVRGANDQRRQDEPMPNVWQRDTTDEYAYQVAYDLSNDWQRETPTWDDVEKAVRLGVQWKMEQLLKGAATCCVEWHDGMRLPLTQEQTDELLSRIEAEIDDRVQVIVIRKND